MAFVLIHDRGRVLTYKQAEAKYVDPTLDKPKTQRYTLRGTWKSWREVKMPKAHNGYRPGFIYDLGEDQCRYIAGDDHVMCGQIVVEGSRYCEAHKRIVTATKPYGKR